MSNLNFRPVMRLNEEKLRLIDKYLVVLQDKLTLVQPSDLETFQSLDSFERPDVATVYVCKILRQDIEYRTLPFTRGQQIPEPLEWLWTIKNAMRTADHITDAIMEIHPQDFVGFGYPRMPETEAQRAWSILMFACDELGRSMIFIEELFPELREEFDFQRNEYSRLWDEELAGMKKLLEVEAQIAALKAQSE